MFSALHDLFGPNGDANGGGVWCRDAPGHPESDCATIIGDRPVFDQQEQRSLRCRRCRSVITAETERISHGEAHLHTVCNPAGIVYEIGCFRMAPGCYADGPASGEFTWFPGYTWRVVLCACCGLHLGWFFSAGNDSFFGLIIKQLIRL